MNELGLPPAPPLPDDVRERVHARVAEGLHTTPRVRGPLLAAAAAAVVALVVSTAVALTGSGSPPPAGLAGSGPPSPTAQATGKPIISGDAVADQALLRCAAAVDASPQRAAWPPTSTWRTSAVLLGSRGDAPAYLGREVVIAINDAFACLAGDSDVWLTATSGPTIGPVQLVRLAPAIVVLLDPQRRPVKIVPEAGAMRDGAVDAPVQLLEFGTAGARTSDLRLSVSGVDAGPLPEPAPIALVANDRPSLSRAPEPPGTTLADCVADALPGARTLVEHPDAPAAIAATVDGRYAGFCVQGPDGPVFRGADIPAGGGPRVVVASLPEYLGVAAVLLAVPDTVTRVTIAQVSSRGPQGSGTPCALGDGFALCTLPTTDQVKVMAYAGSTTVPVR